MLKSFGLLLGAVLLAPSAWLPANAQVVTVDDGAKPDMESRNEGHVEKVIVSATRRDELLQEVPTAVSAFSGESLIDNQMDSLKDLASTAPSVQISGANANANITIRGIGNASLSAGAEPGAAVHLDGAFITQPRLATANFLDVRRVEVLRGPQGTLFGRNATGGAINIIPNTPTATLDYGFNSTLGFNPYELKTSGYVSGPVNDDGTLLGRFAFSQGYNRGYTKNLAKIGPAYLDGASSVAARGQAEYRPSDQFRTRLSVDVLSTSSGGEANYFVGTPDPTTPVPAPLVGFADGSPKKRETYANEGYKDEESVAVTSTSVWSTAAGDLKALLFYNKFDLSYQQDNDGTEAEFSSSTVNNTGHEYFGELIFTSDASKPFRYILGANYMNEALSQDISIPVSTLPIAVDLGADIDTTSYAAFASAELDLTSAFELFGGVRYSRDKKDISDFNVFIGSLNQSDSWNKVTYEFGVSYDVSSDLSTYLKYNTGFKGGGFTAGSLGPSFRPETNANLEAGLKGAFLDDALQANLAVFHMKYDDLQVNQIIGVLSAITNAAKATIDGVEVEFAYLPSEHLRINATGAWLDATFDEFTTEDSARPSLGVLDLSGNQLPGAPEFSGSLGVYYDTPFRRGTLTYGARYDWKSKLYFSEFNIPVSSQDAVGKLDLHLRYASSDKRWSASVFALNVTDEAIRNNVLVYSALLGSRAMAQYSPGRQVGVSLGYHF